MKTHIRLILAASLVCACSVTWFALTPSVPLTIDGADPALEQPAGTGIVAREAGAAVTAPWQAATEDASGDEPGSVEEWHARFAVLVNECGNRDEAGARLVSELDGKYHLWVSSRLAALAELPPIERYDPIAQMEAKIRKVAEAVLGHLGIADGRHYHVLGGTFEALSAEVQYAEMRGTHGQRIAMLRLDREREQRYAHLLATNEPGGDIESIVRNDLEPWYAAEFRGILGIEENE